MKTDWLDGMHFGLTFLNFVTTAHFHTRACPDADAARDVSTANAIPETLGERHRRSPHPRMPRCRNGFLAICGGGRMTRNRETTSVNRYYR